MAYLFIHLFKQCQKRHRLRRITFTYITNTFYTHALAGIQTRSNSVYATTTLLVIHHTIVELSRFLNTKMHKNPNVKTF